MPFKSLHQVIGTLEDQENWKKRQQFRQLVACWAEVVGSAVAMQTRPLYVQRQVLQVATSSAAWAQNLAFERQRILEKLNARLPYQLSDIRFSTAQWQSEQNRSPNASELAILWQNHPSQVSNRISNQSPDPLPVASPSKSSSPIAQDPQTAFRNWAKVMRDRSRNLPTCPNCHCPTPPGELQRWSVCAICAAKTMKG